MTSRQPNLPSRAEELLVDHALCGLRDSEQAELAALLNDDLDNLQDDFMQTAALIQLGMLGMENQRQEQIPDHVRAKILANAEPTIATKSSADNVVAFKPRQNPPAAAPAIWRSALAGWAVAAALAIALVIVRTDTGVELTERGTLVSSAADLITAPWQQSEFGDFKSVTGDVVWSDANQTGFMRLAGMPANNPAKQQYQLWIVAPDRAAEPVDGGVFDIPPGSGEIIIPIDAKLAVSEPVAFAITREKPGGVVVSAGPLLLVAATPGAS